MSQVHENICLFSYEGIGEGSGRGGAMGVRRALEKLVADAVQAELGRTLDSAVAPIRTKAEEVITTAARKAAAPLQAGVERVVGEGVEQLGAAPFKAVWPAQSGTTDRKRW
jgi:hypothetical protein